jgi:hypothetical protein
MKLSDLKNPLPYKWRVQSINEYNAVCVAYIDSRDVQEILDEVCSPENWQSDYKEVKGNVYAGIGIKCGEWVWKWDCGVESKTEAEKGEASDSFKRAAVKWGIGRFLYSLDIQRLKVTKYKEKNYPLNETTNKAIFDGDELTSYINKKMNTPSYNHKANGTDKKPLITNKLFTQLIERVKKDGQSAIDKAKEVYSFEATQLTLLQNLLLQEA